MPSVQDLISLAPVLLAGGQGLHVGLYVITAVCCLTAGIAEWAAGDVGRRSRFWLALALSLFLLAVAREAELGLWLTDRGREFARSHGWYADRHAVQRDVIAAIAALSTLAVAGVLALSRLHWRLHLAAASCAVMLAGLLAVRAVSYHHADQFLSRAWLGYRAGSLAELALNGAIAAGALVATVQARRPGRPPGGPVSGNNQQGHGKTPRAHVARGPDGLAAPASQGVPAVARERALNRSYTRQTEDEVENESIPSSTSVRHVAEAAFENELTQQSTEVVT